MRALWKGTVVAESDDTVVVDGNHYFPPDSIRGECFRPSAKHTTCGWKGVASYYDVVVDGDENKDAAWTYPDPKPEAERIRDRIAFWGGIDVVD